LNIVTASHSSPFQRIALAIACDGYQPCNGGSH